MPFKDTTACFLKVCAGQPTDPSVLQYAKPLVRSDSHQIRV